jgi:hypothetical protein
LNGEAKRLYAGILETANRFLVTGKRFGVSVLKDFDPSFEEVAEIMEAVGKLVYELVNDEDPDLAAQCDDYVVLMKHLALAIKHQDDEEKDRLLVELEKKPFYFPAG